MKRRSVYLFILLLLIAVNIWILLHRNEGYRYVSYKTYSQLYVDDSMLHLQHISFADSTVTLHFSQDLSKKGYGFSTDTSYRTQVISTTNNEISFPVREGIHLYSLHPLDTIALPIVIKIDHSAKANEFIYCNLPGPDIKVSCASTWKVQANAFSKEEMDSAVNLLKTHTKVFDAKTDLEKALELSKYVASLPNNPKGIPQGKLGGFSPLKQLQESIICNADLACGNYTAIYYYLATAASLKTRTITFRGGEQSWNYGIHYYNEVFLKEKQQWAVADPLYNIYFPFDSTGRFYNAADIKKMTDVNGFAGKYVYTFHKDSTSIIPYDSIKSGHEYYHRSNADMVFLHPGIKMGNSSAFNTFIDFYSFNKDVSFYSDTRSNSWGKIILKLATAWLLIFFGLAYLLFEYRSFRKRKRR